MQALSPPPGLGEWKGSHLRCEEVLKEQSKVINSIVSLNVFCKQLKVQSPSPTPCAVFKVGCEPTVCLSLDVGAEGRTISQLCDSSVLWGIVD